MPGYCVAGTVGHKILSGQKKIELDKKNVVCIDCHHLFALLTVFVCFEHTNLAEIRALYAHDSEYQHLLCEGGPSEIAVHKRDLVFMDRIR